VALAPPALELGRALPTPIIEASGVRVGWQVSWGEAR